jgi:hypothetical protein
MGVMGHKLDVTRKMGSLFVWASYISTKGEISKLYEFIKHIPWF